MPHLLNPKRMPLSVWAMLMAIALSSALPWVNSAFIQYTLVVITFGALAYRTVCGPDRLIYGGTLVALITFFFWQVFAYFFFPGQQFIIASSSPLISYAAAIFCIELVQKVRWRTTIMNTASAAILLLALLFIQLWEGEDFRASFMFATMYYLLAFWLLGKAMEMRPWSTQTPRGVRILDTGFIFIIAGVLLYNLYYVAPQSQLHLTVSKYAIADVLANIGLVFMTIAATSRWPLIIEHNTVVRYGFGQDITVGFVPLLLGISGIEAISTESIAVLGSAALISTAILLVEVDSLQHQLNATNRFVRSVAITDRVTGLKNRYALPALMEEPMLGVSVIDVVGLRLVNTSYGYEVGDQVLREFAQRLHARVEDRGTILRSSGNEFIVLWNRRVFDIESRLRSTIAIPFEIENERIYLSLEYGFAQDQGVDTETLIRSAYLAKHLEAQAL